MEDSLRALIERMEPEIVVASGDLTHRGRPDQHAAAAAYPALARPARARDPGEPRHPVHVPRPLYADVRRVERHWKTTEPVFSSDRLHVVGLNSVRAWRQQSGGIRESQLARARELLTQAPEGSLRVVRSASPPDRSAVALAEEAGLEAVESARGARRCRRRADPRRPHPPGRGQRASRVRSDPLETCAAQSSRSRLASASPPDRRGEARGLHVYEAHEDAIRVETYIWREDDWGLTAVRVFARGREPLAVDAVD